LPPSPFKTVIWFTDPYRANELIVYDSVLIIVLKAAERLGLNLGESHSSMANPSDLLLPIQSNRNEVAIEVCRTVDYHPLPAEELRGIHAVIPTECGLS
jgi:hypothetical protein